MNYREMLWSNEINMVSAVLNILEVEYEIKSNEFLIRFIIDYSNILKLKDYIGKEVYISRTFSDNKYDLSTNIINNKAYQSLIIYLNYDNSDYFNAKFLLSNHK